MCGIAGIISHSPIAPALLHAMSATLRHRGPDDEGSTFFTETAPVCLGGPDTPETAYRAATPYHPVATIEFCTVAPAHLAFAHRRLSIQDLSPLGHQPMSYRDRYWMTYNGEVYNFVELRQELEAEGYRFLSQSDTEVILAAYDRWGVDCLSRFNGMWAFALYDAQELTLFLARDRFGVKPLYYWVSPHSMIAFASEIKAFTALPGWQARGNGQRLYDFLAWGIQDHTDETMFAGVFQLPPGHYALWSTQARDLMQYWTQPGTRLPMRQWYQLTAQPFCGDLGTAAAGFKERFIESVRLRLRADVPVGSCLSGGLDSSSIVCVANRLLREQGAQAQQKTFSACADVPRFDERSYIDIAVAHTGVEPHYTYPAQDTLFEILPDLTWHQDEPFGSTSIFAQWCVFALAAQQRVKVMLDGQGADEQLAGYHDYFGPYLAGLAKDLAIGSLWREWRAIRAQHGYSDIKLAKWMISNLVPALVQPAAAILGQEHSALTWLDMNCLGATPRDPFHERGARTTSVKTLSYAQLTAMNLQMLLHWEDRDSMAHSIESRVPFLDYRLVEYVLGLPDECKIAAGITKRVLREGMRGILPEAIRQRMDKLGFVTPEEVWVRERSTARFRAALEDAITISQGVLTSAALDRFDAMVSGKRPFNFFIWRLISFGAWVKRFGVVLG